MASWSLTAERNNGFDCTFAIGGISCIAAPHYRRNQIECHTSQSHTDSTGNLQSRSASHRRCTTSPFCVRSNSTISTLVSTTTVKSSASLGLQRVVIWRMPFPLDRFDDLFGCRGVTLENTALLREPHPLRLDLLRRQRWWRGQ